MEKIVTKKYININSQQKITLLETAEEVYVDCEDVYDLFTSVLLSQNKTYSSKQKEDAFYKFLEQKNLKEFLDVNVDKLKKNNHTLSRQTK